ncbi:6PGL phosphogluconolactonase, partial [Bucco capensis]|nr:6PGL phosphogluconolactonase [Bucco capensis]
PALAQLIAEQAAAAAAARGRFSLGLSGGSLIGLLARDLPPAVARSGPAAPGRWLVALCDERLVPREHQDNTAAAYEVTARWARGARNPRLLCLSFPCSS